MMQWYLILSRFREKSMVW